MRAQFLFLVILAAALPAHSQWHSEDPAHLFDRFQDRMQQNPANSAEFARFGESLARTTPDIGPLPDPREYRLVWAVHCEGITRSVRGNVTDLETFLEDPPEKRFGDIVCCPRFYGGLYAVVHWAPPSGLVRYRYLFFERVNQ
jgi:hypothetical protein